MLHDAEKLYGMIKDTANHFLHNAKHFSVELLSEDNPSFEELADIMARVAKIIWALADDFDPWLCTKAFDYSDLMQKMGAAIKNKDQDELTKLTEILDKRNFL